VNHRDLSRAAGKAAVAGAAVALLGLLAAPFAPSCLPGGDADSVLLTAGLGACVGDRSVLFVVASGGFLIAAAGASTVAATALYRRVATPP
jgi:hypothetical protein